MYLLIWSQLSEIERCKEYALQISLRKAFKAKRTEYKASEAGNVLGVFKKEPEATGEMQVKELEDGV